MGMCKLFFKDATKIQNGQRPNFLSAQKLTESQKLFKFYYHISHYIDMHRWLFQGFTEIQNDHHRSSSYFLWVQKLIIEVRYNSFFTITSPTICKCAGDLLKFEMATTSRLFNRKTLNLIYGVG